jgi:hypothetical protein
MYTHLEKRQTFSLDGTETQILRQIEKLRYGHITPIIIMCRQDRHIQFL